MSEDIKMILDRDLLLRKQYIDCKANGADKHELNKILKSIEKNMDKYDNAINININEEKTVKHKIKNVITNVKESLGDNAFLVGLSVAASLEVLASVGGYLLLKDDSSRLFFPIFFGGILGIPTAYWLLMAICSKIMNVANIKKEDLKKLREEIEQNCESIKNNYDVRGLSR